MATKRSLFDSSTAALFVLVRQQMKGQDSIVVAHGADPRQVKKEMVDQGRCSYEQPRFFSISETIELNSDDDEDKLQVTGGGSGGGSGGGGGGGGGRRRPTHYDGAAFGCLSSFDWTVLDTVDLEALTTAPLKGVPATAPAHLARRARAARPTTRGGCGRSSSP
jgi:hypothetical protein